MVTRSQVFWFCNDRPVRSFAETVGFQTRDILEELEWMVDRLEDAGYTQLIVTDFTMRRIRPARAVRVIIPGLESTNPLFTGPRARATLIRDLLPRHAAERRSMRVIDLCPAPRFIVWDITFACPLRCTHCYSESGRRAARQLGAEDLYRVTDAMIAAGPSAIILSGGEPLIVPEIFAVAERMVAAGVAVILYTSGWSFAAAMLPEITRLMARVTVSIDGATAKVHDRIRGRAGSFDRAMDTLAHLDRAVGELRRHDKTTPALGVDFVVMQSNFDHFASSARSSRPAFQSCRRSRSAR